MKKKKMVNLASFSKTEVCSQTVLPDMQISVEPKLLENAKILQLKTLNLLS